MPSLFNPTQFPVFVAAIGKQLAPFEQIVVSDADAVAKAVATGVLTDDIDRWTSAMQSYADVLDRDIADVEQDIASAVATWHDEHDAPAAQVAEEGQVVEPDPVVNVPDSPVAWAEPDDANVASAPTAPSSSGVSSPTA